MVTTCRKLADMYTAGTASLPESLTDLRLLYEEVLRMHFDQPIYAQALDRILTRITEKEKTLAGEGT